MKPSTKLAVLLITACLTSPAFSQGTIECTSDPFGGTYCSGPGGYQAQGQRYTGDIESWHDNRGNQADVQHHSFGSTSINATRTSSDTWGNNPSPFNRSGNASSTSLEALIAPAGEARSERVRNAPAPLYNETPEPIPDRSQLPKTPEEYRLTALWMKAVDEKKFEKADDLRKRIGKEQFKNATPAGQRQMIQEAREKTRLEFMRVLDMLDKYLRTVAAPTAIPNLRMLRETIRKSSEEEDRKFTMLLAELGVRQEAAARESLRDAELQALLESEKDEAKLEEKMGELIAKWNTEDEERRIALEERLNRLIATDAVRGKAEPAR